MISIFTESNSIWININNCSSFTTVLAILKQNKCVWSKEKKLWKIPIGKYETVVSEVENWDEVINKLTEADVLEVLTGAPELKVSSTRTFYNYDFLTSKPLIGKHPYEDFQKIDINSGISRNRYAFFLGMGSGKSYIASALIAYHYKNGPVSKVVLLTSNIGVNNLYHEVIKFVKGLDPSKVKIIDKTNRNCFDDKSIDIVIMNYITWRLVCNHYKKTSAAKPRKSWLPIKEWAENKDAMLLLDESHLVANHQSQQGNYMATNASLFQYRYLFTGTPADTPEKLYNQYKILDPYLIHNLPYSEWIPLYANVGNRFSLLAINSWKYDKLEELNKLFTSRYGVYRKTEDILELPENYSKKIRVPMYPKHRKLYQDIVVSSLNNLPDYMPTTVVNTFPYAMMALENPSLLLKHRGKFNDGVAEAIEKFDVEKDQNKLIYLDEIVNDVQKGKKGVIWCIHPSTVELLVKRYEKLNPLFVHGGVAKEGRFELATQFNNNPKNQLMIAVISTMNTSINLTAASWQCYVERPANYTEYDQSRYRIYRNGQTKDVYTYELIYENSLDMFRDSDLTNKGLLVKGLVGKDFISPETWKDIFNYNKDSDEPFEF